MLQLVVWLVISGIIALVSRSRLWLLTLASVLLWVLVPAVAKDVVTGVSGGTLSLHPATWLIFVALGVQMVTNRRQLFGVVSRNALLMLAIVAPIFAGVLTTKFGAYGNGLTLLVDLMAAPVVLFVLTLAAIEQEPRAAAWLRTALLVIAAASIVLVLLQWRMGQVLVYHDAHLSHYWFSDSYNRWMATFDHPLVLSYFLSAVIPLADAIQARWLRFAFALGGVVAVMITQSRLGLAVMAAVFLFLAIRTRMSLFLRILTYATMAAAALVLARSAIAEGVAGRIADDTGSTQARELALEFLARTWSHYVVVGDGFTASYRVGRAGGLETSLESSVLMYAIDLGVLFTLLYFGAQVVILITGANAKADPGLLLGATIAVVLAQTFSALAAGSACAAVLWVLLALVRSHTDVPRSREQARAAARWRGQPARSPLAR